MADRIVWDFERFEEIHSQLWDASEQLEECAHTLQQIAVNEAYPVRKNGPASRQIIDQLDVLILRTARLGLQAETLCKTTGRVNYKIYGNERENVSAFRALPTGNTDDSGRSPIKLPFPFNKGHISVVIPVIPFMPRRHIYIPAWLDDAINIAFGQK